MNVNYGYYGNRQGEELAKTGVIKEKSMKLLILAIVLGLAMPGVSLADCEDDCNGPFQTCLNICRQTTKEDSPEASECVNNCLKGVSGCIKRCRDKDKKSENFG
jgi:hypothetical protein